MDSLNKKDSMPDEAGEEVDLDSLQGMFGEDIPASSATYQAEDDDNEDYVPESLQFFVKKADQTLQQTQNEFLLEGASPRHEDTFDSTDDGGLSSPPRRQHPMSEDEHDKQLKGEILQRYETPVVATNHIPDFLSPDLLQSPPPNPVLHLTDSEVKQMALLEHIPDQKDLMDLVSTAITYESTEDDKLVRETVERKESNVEELKETFTKDSEELQKIYTNEIVTAHSEVTMETMNDETKDMEAEKQAREPSPREASERPLKQLRIETTSQDDVELLNVSMEEEVHAEQDRVVKVQSAETTPPAEEIPPVERSSQAVETQCEAEKPTRSPSELKPAVPSEPKTPAFSEPLVSEESIQTFLEELVPAKPTESSRTPPRVEPTPPVSSSPSPMPPLDAPPPTSSQKFPLDAPPPPPPEQKPKRKNTPDRQKVEPIQVPTPDSEISYVGEVHEEVMAHKTAKEALPMATSTPGSKSVASTRRPQSTKKGTPSSSQPSKSTKERPWLAPPPPPPNPPPSRKKSRPGPTATTSPVDRLSRPTAASSAAKSSVRCDRKAPDPPASKSSAPSATSRLMRGTAASQAGKASPSKVLGASSRVMDGKGGSERKSRAAQTRKQPISTKSSRPSSRLMEETAASQARTGAVVPIAHKVVSSPEVVNESREKARERIRQRRQQFMKEKEQREAASKETSRHAKFSADEGIARARERVRQRLLQQKAAAEKENRAKSNAAAGRRASTSRRSGKKPTVPQAPKFATDAKYGERRVHKQDQPALAACSGSFEKELRSGDYSKESKTSRPSKGKPPLTVPKAPKFATDAIYGEKVRAKGDDTTLAQSSELMMKNLRHSDDVSVDGSVGSHGSGQRRLTVPHAPHFATTDKLGERQLPPRRVSWAQEPTLAQSTDVLAKGLREETPGLTVKRESKLTIPTTPKFHQSSKRELPKSTEERERELMEQYNAHPFKARPVRRTVSASKPPATKPSNRRKTMPEPFHLRSDERVGKKPVEPTPNKEEEDLKEMKRQFHARQMPSFSKPAKSQPNKIAAARHHTTPEPFKFSTKSRASAVAPTPRSEEKEPVLEFKARPLPKSTFKSPSQPKTPLNSPSSQPSDIKPPTLRSTARAERRQAASEASHKKAEKLAQEKEVQARIRQRKKHNDAILKAEAKSPMPPQEPFTLQSSLRHEAYQKQMEEKRREEQAEQKRQTAFHARSFHTTPTPEKIKSPRQPTASQPFHLSSVARHQAYDEEQRRRLQAEEDERKKQAKFKARRIPKTTYEYKQILPKGGPLVDPFSPELQMKQRAVERKAYDEYADQERVAEEARKKAIEERMAAEEEEELREQRSLPVSEGGMIPTAQPVNAVFLQDSGS